MRIAAVQMDIAWEDQATNRLRIEAALAAADLAPGTFVVLPELAETGFSMSVDALVDDDSVPWARATAARHGVWMQHGYPARGDDGLGRNCMSILTPDGGGAGTYRKVHPFTYGQEPRSYGGGDRLLLRRCPDAVVCPIICYDLRFPELWRLAVRGGAEVFTLGANWPRERQHHWRALLVARAIENQAFVVGVNRVGTDPNLAYAGGSMIVSPQGEVLAEAGDGPEVITAALDLESLRAWRARFPALQDMRRELLGSIRIDGLPPPTATGGTAG